ncbi:MAG: aldehyde dehydrogenase [bacterium]|nr:aldehyde dehydrogenase [bacterium]
MDKTRISRIIQEQIRFFSGGETKKISFRIRQLRILKKAVIQNQELILDALRKDLGKPEFEAYMAEIYAIKQEIGFTLRHIRKWARPRNIPTPFTQHLGRGRFQPEPYGVALIIAPWNFPFNLVMVPLVSAVAAGNCAVLKPSEVAPHTSKVVARIISKYFPPEYITVVEGGVKETQLLLEQKFDRIFYTGSPAVGKIIMRAASRNLIPVTLELGGKSPCIIDRNVPLLAAAKRVVWGKFYNAGQACVSVDYVVVHREIKEQFIRIVRDLLSKFFGPDPVHNPDMARIIDEKHFSRLTGYLKSVKNIVIGGQWDKKNLTIAPAVLDHVQWTDPIMKEEIFGPILPVLEYEDLEDVIRRINGMPKPLVLYLYTRNNKVQRQVVERTSSGGVCINDSVVQFLNLNFPFGGIGNSGMGKYHGKAGFDAFTHNKAVFKKSFLIDLFFFRYPPFTKLHRFSRRFF